MNDKNNQISIGHGSGGKLSQALFQNLFSPYFSNPFLDEIHDGAIFEINGARLAMSTDSYVVSPIFFPGGNIGDLAVNGTVNDVSMCGAKPLYLSCGFILEEGFSMVELEAIVKSMKIAADKAGVYLVTGDTKVVEKGKVDKIYINTSGIGVIEKDITISPKNAIKGDVVIINGGIADHGIAIMSKREGLDFTTDIESDSASLNHMIQAVLEKTKHVHVLRDPTRGGLSATLNEIAEASQVGVYLQETSLPIHEQVKTASALLGLDPLYIANEGKAIIIVPEENATKVLTTMRSFEEGKNSVIIGNIQEKNPGKVILETKLGTKRIVDMPSAEQLPRIC
jgi:hydrogenase expression/formation protein HypE